jgi:hypothetical protein
MGVRTRGVDLKAGAAKPKANRAARLSGETGRAEAKGFGWGTGNPQPR